MQRHDAIAKKYAFANALGVRAAVTGDAAEAARAKALYEEAKAEEAALNASTARRPEDDEGFDCEDQD
jgi:hypothetical protein